MREPTLATYKQLVTQPANIDIVLRTLTMAIAVTIACAIIALPIATYMARYARGRMKALFYVGVMLPMWTSYLVKVYAWRLLLAKEGIIAWVFGKLGLRGLLEAVLAAPGIGGPSLSSSYLGMFIVFVYMWLPFMILPMAAALERVPGSLLQASADLGARPAQTFRNVVLPLAVPGHRRRLGVHVLADARRLHHPERGRRAGLFHRHDGLRAAGHGRQHSAGGGVLGGADRADLRLSIHRQALRSLRCALEAIPTRRAFAG